MIARAADGHPQALEGRSRCEFLLPACHRGRRDHLCDHDLGQLIAVSPQGQKLWTFSGESIRASSPAIGNDGTIYFGTGEYGSNGGGPAYLYAVKPNGTELWQDSIGDNHPSAPLIDPQGRVLLGNENTCYCVNPNGSLAWSSNDVRANRLYCRMGAV